MVLQGLRRPPAGVCARSIAHRRSRDLRLIVRHCHQRRAPTDEQTEIDSERKRKNEEE